MTATRFSWDELVRITGGSWLGDAPAAVGGGGVTGVVDDSRSASCGSLFVAIPGELADGHRFVGQALAAGAGALCLAADRASASLRGVDRGGVPVLVVGDTLGAFQALAAAHRRRFPALTVIGVTGSCGKTSTKEMIAAVLEKAFPGQVLKTEGNTNNHFGVPRNLLRVSASHRVAVIEAGSNHPGEIHSLAALIRPDIGVVCNIGAAHLEHFGDLRGVANEKGDMLSGTAPDGTVIYPHGAAHVEVLREKAGARSSLTFGTQSGSDVCVTYLGGRGSGYALRLAWPGRGLETEVTWAWGGEHQAVNAGAAAAVGTALGLSPAVIAAGLQQCRLPGMRMERHDVAGAVWINDAYNANPDSMRAALLWFAEAVSGAGAKRMVLVLGDMLELGNCAAAAHREILVWAQAHLSGARIFTVGPLMAAAASSCGLANVASAAEAVESVRQQAVAGTWILLKASRGIGLEALLPAGERR